MGHARALLALTQRRQQIEVGALVAKKGLSVRDTEALVRAHASSRPAGGSGAEGIEAARSERAAPAGRAVGKTRRDGADPARAARARASSSSATTVSMSSTASSRTSSSALAAALLPARGCASLAARASRSTRTISATASANWHIEAEKPGAHRRARRRARHRRARRRHLVVQAAPRGPGRHRVRSHGRRRGRTQRPGQRPQRLLDGEQRGWPPARVRARAQRRASPSTTTCCTYYVGPRRQPQHHHAFPPLRRRSGESSAAARARPDVRRGAAGAESPADHHADRQWPAHRIPARRQAAVRLEDPAPYMRGWFALRTTWSHLRIGTCGSAGPNYSAWRALARSPAAATARCTPMMTPSRYQAGTSGSPVSRVSHAVMNCVEPPNTAIDEA